jgi:hypothetical protein
VFSAATGSFDFQPPLINTKMKLSAADELDLNFAGFAMQIRYFRGTNSEVQYTITKPGSPPSDTFAFVFGTTILDPGAGGTSTFRQLDLEIAVSPTDRIRITLNKNP